MVDLPDEILMNPDDWPPGPTELQAYQLIGEFMFHWANLEQEVNRGLSALLDLGNLEGAIVEANMQWRDKIHTLRTCVSIWSTGSEKWKADADAALTKIGNMSNLRNTVAHNMFIPRKKGGVKFYVTKAKGRLDWPETVWTKKQFELHRAAIKEATLDLGFIIDMVADERPKRPTTEQVQTYVKSLFAPTPAEAELRLRDRLSRPPRSSRRSETATPETPPQMPKAPRGKPRN